LDLNPALLPDWAASNSNEGRFGTSTVPETVGHTEGFYTAERNGLRYGYRASWTIVLDTLIWNGTVQTSDGELAGSPSGLILGYKEFETDLEQVVKEQIEAAIEKALR
jgi:hypothetical protein